MSVKTVCEGKRCLYQEKPDGYGCALGCALHQDSDICRYQRSGSGLPYVTGSVLLPEITDQAAMDRLMGVLQEKLSGVRFFGLPEQAGSSIVQKIVAIQKSEPEEASAPEAAQGRPTCKRYFIGAASELKDATIASISRGEPDHIPVILGNGQSICCSGFLKYSPE
jgi:hypothetical protein